MFRTIDTATRLIDSGIVPIPLYPGTKRPIGEGWQLATMPSVAQLSDLWPDEEGRNIGALMGHSSDNTQGFDFDVYGAWARWRGEYKPPETTTIFTARGIRTIYKTTPDAIQSANIIDNGMRVGELLGNGHQMVMPPSRLANGFEYSDNGKGIAYLPPNHPAFMALLRLTEKTNTGTALAEYAQVTAKAKRHPARFARAALEGRVPIGHESRFNSRSELDAAVIQSLARSGYDAGEIYNMLDRAELRSHWHERNERSKREEITRVIAKFINTHSSISREAIKRADALATFRTSSQWRGVWDTGLTKRATDTETGEIIRKPVFVSGGSVEAVLLAHELKVRDCLNYTYQMDCRVGDGRFAGLGRETIIKANRAIVKVGIIRVAKPAKGSCAAVYQLPPVAEINVHPRVESDTLSTTSTPSVKTGVQEGVEVVDKVSLSTPLTSIEGGIFLHGRSGGLGASAFRVYRVALDCPLTLKQIAAKTGMAIRTVRTGAKKLARYGLIEKQPGRRWKSDPKINWQAVGDYLNTTQKVDERQERTKADRLARANGWKEHNPQRAATKGDDKPLARAIRSAKPFKRLRFKEKVR